MQALSMGNKTIRIGNTTNRQNHTGTRVVKGDAVVVTSTDVELAPPPVVAYEDVKVLLTCHNGSRGTVDLIRDLISSCGDRTIDVLVYDDCSFGDDSELLETARALCSGMGWRFVSAPSRHGVGREAVMLHALIEDAAKSMLDGDVLIVLRDDVRLSSDFFLSVERYWRAAPEHPCVMIPELDSRSDRTRFGMLSTKSVREFTMVDWVDRCFVAGAKALHSIVGSPPSFFEEESAAIEKSGFDVYMSLAMRRAQVPVFVTPRSLTLYTGDDKRLATRSFADSGSSSVTDGPSNMTPAQHMTSGDRVVVGIHSRGDGDDLRVTVESLAGQVDELRVFMSSHEQVPQFMRDEHRCKVQCTESTAEHPETALFAEGGAFMHMPDDACYFVAVSDGVSFPSDFIRKMLEKVDEHERGAVIATSGIVLKKFPDREHFISHPDEDTWTDVPNVGGSIAYHTGSVKLSRHVFKNLGLGSYDLAVELARQEVPIVVAGLGENYLEDDLEMRLSYEGIPQALSLLGEI